MKKSLSLIAVAALLMACSSQPAPQSAADPVEAPVSEAPAPGVCQSMSPMGQFLDQANITLTRLVSTSEQMNWKYMTDINAETEAALTESEGKMMAERSALIAAANAFQASDATCDDQLRQWTKLRTDTALPPPKDAEKQAKLAEISSKLIGYYGAAKACEGDKCMDLGALSDVLVKSSNPEEMKKAWIGWHNAFDSQKPLYQEFVTLGNEGAKDIGFNDLSEVWLAGYDAPAAEFQAEIKALWNELKPLYDSLHCYVRAKLSEKYGADVVPLDKPIPAHLLGNMWAQEWNNIYPIVVPYPDAPNLDATPKIKEKLTPVQMVETCEDFYESLGMRALPKSFYMNSMFTKPADREVVCHASAWDLDTKGDVRIKLCIEPNTENLMTIQHELGHIYYYLYYNHLPFVYQGGANDGFHEGIGDTLTLSMTPKYLQQIGLLDAFENSPESTINQQMQSALDKIAFLPFGLLIDEWRWRVFDGSVTPENYNAAWWKLREELQGVSAPETRDETHFDAGAKYHVPGNTPYLRYFIARILQFQFHKALCDAAGHQGPLHECSIYQSKAAGEKLAAMLSKGASQPWQKTLEEMTGSPKMSAAAMLEYYAPLKTFLDEQNQGKTCGF